MLERGDRSSGSLDSLRLHLRACESDEGSQVLALLEQAAEVLRAEREIEVRLRRLDERDALHQRLARLRPPLRLERDDPTGKELARLGDIGRCTRALGFRDGGKERERQDQPHPEKHGRRVEGSLENNQPGRAKRHAVSCQSLVSSPCLRTSARQ